MKHLALSLLAGTALLGFMSASYAADLIIEEPVEVGIVDVSGDWDGVFIGGFLGYGWGDADHIPADPGDDPGNDIALDGWLAGVQIGANATVSEGIVLGVVADAAWSGISGSIINPPLGISDEITQTIDWMASLRGRIGFDGGAFLPYLTGGLAVMGGTRESFDADAGPVSATHVGWTVGAGVEFMATEDVSIDLLYRYTDYGAAEYVYGSSPTVDINTHTIQVGLNWHF